MEHLTWKSVRLEQMNSKMSRRVINGEKVMVSEIMLAKDAFVPLHHHESEQISYVIRGAIKFELEGREVIVRAGEVLIIPSNIPHQAVALEETYDLDIFSPIRTDWLTGKDDYLRKG